VPNGVYFGCALLLDIALNPGANGQNGTIQKCTFAKPSHHYRSGVDVSGEDDSNGAPKVPICEWTQTELS
jgi:hypothetical protein